MTFTKRIQENYMGSAVAHCIAILVEGMMLLYLLCIYCTTTVVPLIQGERLSGSVFGNVMAALMVLGVGAIFVLLIRWSVRCIRRGNLGSFLKTLAPYGDPKALLAAVDNLPVRGLRGVDLRFNEEYFAYARKREIFIRPMKQVHFVYDYGRDTQQDPRTVVVRFSNGQALWFSVPHSDIAQVVIRDLVSKSAIGKLLAQGAESCTFTPFTYRCPWDKNYTLECDGKELTFRGKNGPAVLPLESLEGCYTYYIPDGDSDDRYYLVLYLQNGAKIEVPVSDGHNAYRLFLQLRNCAPQLEYSRRA